MPLWLYDLPNGLLGTLIALGWVTLGLGGHTLLHRAAPIRFHDNDKEVALALVAVVATMNSLLLAFSAVAVWESFSAAGKAVSSEATTVSQLGRDLAIYGSAQSHRAREQLKSYTRLVVTQEWLAMRAQRSLPAASDALDELFRAVGEIYPQGPREQALLPEIWSRTNELIRFRRDRLEASHGEVPGTLWIVVLLGTLLTLVPACVIPLTVFNRAAVGILSLSMGLVFFFIAAMDRPFAGKESISPAPFELTLMKLERWDRISASLQRNADRANTP